MKRLNAIEIAAAACGLVSNVSCTEISQEALEKAMVQVEVWNIIRAAKEIWYDNGMINRFEPEEEMVTLLVQWLSSLDKVLICDMEAELSKLNDDDLHTLCCGEESEQDRIGSKEVNEFLCRIFDEEYEVKAESKEG
ncbi:hypothetical protein RFK95_15745 [Acinetobacter pittii]|uniref:Uncharacterized protein n=1 Tax=Acinetobacter pittii TaxID=48296 RepID=A0AB37TD74_ACIPI|nr:hypothetical protein [Acinetobacter pittii]MDR0067227.1 hypothetical protein [Acinetobacter sp. 11520]MDU6099986.1 hypothetical protein [Acinetobacter sp.]KQG01711.1 hypothetical protein APC29_03675 [Acinetobacter pittii]MBM0876641.1 hypothetical protein [Acinetobacter pittii]MCU4620104.1 hypothetical protein [Acinetobacter pittii]